MIGLLLFSWMSCAGNLLIVSDEPELKTAKEVAQLFRETPPFSLLEKFAAEVEEVQTRDLSCTSRGSFVCHLTATGENRVLSKRADRLPERVLIIKNESERKGAAFLNGFYAAMTTETEAWAGLHEVLHTLGFNDEYAYDEERAKAVCRGVISTPNVFGRKLFHDAINENLAWNVYWGLIPWRDQIARGTPLTKDNRLQTPDPHMIGLHACRLCLNATTGFQTWKPVDEQTLMEGFTTHIPRMHWELIARKLHARLKESP